MKADSFLFLVNCRAGTIISEAWEDGQALKDLNAQLVRSVFGGLARECFSCSFIIWIY